MASATRPYIVTDRESGQTTIVEDAMTPAQAMRAVASERFTVAPASAAEILALMKAGTAKTISCKDTDPEPPVALSVVESKAAA